MAGMMARMLRPESSEVEVQAVPPVSDAAIDAVPTTRHVVCDAVTSMTDAACNTEECGSMGSTSTSAAASVSDEHEAARHESHETHNFDENEVSVAASIYGVFGNEPTVAAAHEKRVKLGKRKAKKMDNKQSSKKQSVREEITLYASDIELDDKRVVKEACELERPETPQGITPSSYPQAPEETGSQEQDAYTYPDDYIPTTPESVHDVESRPRLTRENRAIAHTASRPGDECVDGDRPSTITVDYREYERLAWRAGERERNMKRELGQRSERGWGRSKSHQQDCSPSRGRGSSRSHQYNVDYTRDAEMRQSRVGVLGHQPPYVPSYQPPPAFPVDLLRERRSRSPVRRRGGKGKDNVEKRWHHEWR